ncbi:uncharacterized protein OCT59_003377 [Rhizophagus irregularis]|uniref:Crinkler family protein n=4 Tax=Rhizophagus irregularis TaxID=588596 RepID=U9TPY9_RHIID|nr:hypothetical protein GLOIN_2v1776191 [Rhizophagus irregularis DAOM 181602=DAOM 197198]EXX63344.1 hypothetical protein RirG_153270 [Rhizophagus irregularis DAOM 197198w]UZO11821.1 hypothetical protein OCT59_003377 [Rhizophagus irregularis]POG70118.1 hypothetical protein GLOIN_2v1776191 [Rhizophagus irregularis DAOM 181602=DAOM 197198]CAB4485838.1 unnamed protein product [Rhizophagus irregularis]CAB5203498.1 unnamed protein product [Rhizophagus irregularis]|eukprot:XP_025176984.1 hypothetical protein GLOIN_2v1776191 [Rhizophagus irregularis DAOM 181602=DAOM 197198]
MWIHFEGTPKREKLILGKDDLEYIGFLDYNDGSYSDLDDLKHILRKHYPEILKNIGNRHIEIFDKDYEDIDPETDLSTLNIINYSETLMIIRYPLSDTYIMVTFTYDSHNNNESYGIPHTTGSFYLLIKAAKKIFNEFLKEETEIYFIHDKMEIKDAYGLNVLVSKTKNNNKECVLNLKIIEKNKKSPNTLDLKSVFEEVLLSKNCQTLEDLPILNLKELPELDQPFPEEVLENFLKDLNEHLDVFTKVIVTNESMSHAYINFFMITAVRHVRSYMGNRLQLNPEKEQNSNGLVEYAMKLMLCEAKADNMDQGAAQIIVQLHNAVEQRSNKRKHGQEEQIMFGIVTTGMRWRFFRWSGLSKVHVSEEYICNFEGNMKYEKELLEYIARMLQFQAKSNEPSKRQNINDK